MTSATSEWLTTQFYDWEKRGRGWFLFDTPIELEPPFHPFFFHGLVQAPIIDDGRRPTIVSNIVDFIRRRSTQIKATEAFPEIAPVEPFISETNEALKVFSISLPKEHHVGLEETEQLLLMLSYLKKPVSFEIVGSEHSIALQFTCRENESSHLVSQIKAYFPESIILEKGDALSESLKNLDLFGSAIDFGLREEFMRPLTMTKNFDLDPFTGLFGILENLAENEHAVIQVLFTGAVNPWAESTLRSVMDNEEDDFFVDAPDMVPLAKEKISAPLFAVTLRVLGISITFQKAFILSQNLTQAFVRISTSQGNSLLPLYTETYDFETRLNDILLRESHRLGMLLNSRELATFVHYPSPSVVSSKLERDKRKTKAAPKITEGHSFVLGMNEHQGKIKEVSESSDQRLKHTHIVGATGTGKSTFLQNLIVEDITQGNGIAVLDPHGDLIESIISYIPEGRVEDVVIIDPADSEFPIGFNILSAHSEIEKEILSSDLVAGFRRLSTSWGDQMNSVFANAILAFLESDEGGTLADVRRFLVEKSFRDSFLKAVPEPNVTYYWQKEYPLLRTNSIGPILTRLDTFLRPKLIRNMVSQKKGLDFENLLDSKKIILIKLSQGLIGTENSYLLGTVIVSKIHQAAMARQAKTKADRSDFFLYIDEFQNFITPSMSSILSGARKYHLGLILAHQDMQQLVKIDSELASSVLSNAGTRICFRVGDADAKRFADGFSSFESEDLQNLNTGEAIARVDRPEFDFSLSVEPLSATPITEEQKLNIISRSRIKYSTPRVEVERILRVTRDEIEVTQEVEVRKEPPPQVIKGKVERTLVEEKKEEVVAEIKSNTVEKLKKQKEQSQHRYLQSLIKKMAESRGYKALIEEGTEDGKGRVDVHLERNKKKIAVEISITTESEWEKHNIEKCLASGYDIVIACSTEKKTLDAIQQKLEETLNEEQLEKIHVFEPESLFSFLDSEIAKDASTESTIKGFRVKVEYQPVSENEMIKKREMASRLVIDSMKKIKKQ